LTLILSFAAQVLRQRSVVRDGCAGDGGIARARALQANVA
jgi:hypothetical protein